MHIKLVTGTVLAVLILGLAMSGNVMAGTQTIAGMTFTGPNTYNLCVNSPTSDTITITGVGSNTLIGAVWASYITDSGPQQFEKYTINQTGDLNLKIAYPPVSQWPPQTNSTPPGMREIHVDVSISAYDPLGGFLGLFDGSPNMGWDVYCLWTPTPTPTSTPRGPGTGTPGYWMNHPAAWPVTSITIGGQTYTRDQAISIMKQPTSKDMTYVMFAELVAAKLNVLVGNDSSCIASTISQADAWLTSNPLGSGVSASSAAWQPTGQSLANTLDNYNNGKMCAPKLSS